MSDSFLDMNIDVSIPEAPARVIPKMKQEATLISLVSSTSPVRTPVADVVEWNIIRATWEFTFGPVTDFFKKDSMTIDQDVFVGMVKNSAGKSVPSVALKENGSPVNGGLSRFFKALGASTGDGANMNSLVGKSAMATVGPEERDGQPTGYARVFAVYPVK